MRFGFPIQVIFSLRRKQVHLIPVLARPLVQKRSRHMMLVKYEQQFSIFVCLNCHFPFCNVKSRHRLNRCFSNKGVYVSCQTYFWVAQTWFIAFYGWPNFVLPLKVGRQLPNVGTTGLNSYVWSRRLNRSRGMVALA